MTDTSKEAPVYLIRKSGSYYRPNCQGYTGSAIQAGRYTLTEAMDITHPNGPDGPRDNMTFIHEDAVLCCDWTAYRAIAAERDALRAQIATARADALPDSEEVAALVYGAMAYLREDMARGWVKGVNSHAQTEARRVALRILALIDTPPAQPEAMTVLLTLNVETDESGLLHLTSPQHRGLLMSGRNLSDIMADLPMVLDALAAAGASLGPPHMDGKGETRQ